MLGGGAAATLAAAQAEQAAHVAAGEADIKAATSRALTEIEAVAAEAAGAAEAFGAFLADAANAGLYQATHLSLQESECAEAFRAAVLALGAVPETAS